MTNIIAKPQTAEHQLHTPDGRFTQAKVRSFVGLLPLLAVETLEPEMLERLPRFRSRLEWFLKYRPGLIANVASLTEPGAHDHYQLSILSRDKLARILGQVFDPGAFLSDYGLRALSRDHAQHPYEVSVHGQTYRVDYQPAESDTGLFGGNSNWRGPIWFPLNYLMIEALRKHGHHYGDSLKVELPAGSGQQVTLDATADELCRRLARIFLCDKNGQRAVFGQEPLFQTDPHWRDYMLFYEYFHGDTGAGVGASHQTGWTALVAKLLHDSPGSAGRRAVHAHGLIHYEPDGIHADARPAGGRLVQGLEPPQAVAGLLGAVAAGRIPGIPEADRHKLRVNLLNRSDGFLGDGAYNEHFFGDASMADLVVKAVREQARYSVPALSRQRRTRARLAAQPRP